MIDNVLRHLDTERDAVVQRLCDWLRIPSISTDPAHADDVRRAAQWVRDDLADIGFDADIRETAGHPAVVATCFDAGDDATTVLFYGHYDVQPPDPVEAWDSPPFEPTVRDGKLFARGASDDKGQVFTFLEAVRAWKRQAGALPVNMKFLLEGEEEIGSRNLPAFLDEHKHDLAADVCVVCDTAMWQEARPAITCGLRGLTYFDVKLHGPNRDLHSGVYGGALANPANMLTRILGRLQDDDNRVTIPGFYDDVIALTDDERDEWAALQSDADGFLGAVGVNQGYGEMGYNILERRWARPSCDVNGLYGGYSGEGAKTIIPSFAGAKVSFRLAAMQDPHRIAELFEHWLRRHDTGGCRWEIALHGIAHPVIVSRDSPYMQAARDAIKHASGQDAALIREGATIPVVADLQRKLGIESLLIGFARHDDAIHSPNEKYDLDNLHLGCRTMAVLLHTLADAKG